LVWSYDNVSGHYKNPTESVGLVESRHHHYLIKNNVSLAWRLLTTTNAVAPPLFVFGNNLVERECIGHINCIMQC
jgi:hypothetical protein